MASLGALPVELLRIIGGYVYANAEAMYGPGTSRVAIYSLASSSLTDWRLHEVFNPLLYQWDRNHESHAVAWAIKFHKLPTLRKIISFGLDANRTSWDGYSANPILPISIALKTPSLDCLKLLLENGANPDGELIIDHPHRITDSSSSLYSSQTKHQRNEEAALILLDHGARTFFREPSFSSGRREFTTTALHQAAECGHAKVVQRLLAEGLVEVNLKDCYGSTALYYAARRSEDTTAIVKMLLEHGADTAGSNDLLGEVFRGGHVEHVVLLLPKYTDLCHSTLYDYLGDLNLRLFDNTEPCLVNSLDQDVPKIISKLIDIGADFNNPPPPFMDFRSTPLLSLAASQFDPFIFETLVQFGANPLIKMQRINDSFNVLLDTCVRTDVIEPVTGQTIFETAVDMCDEDFESDSEFLHYLLTQGPSDNLISSHGYDVLDSRIERLGEHLNGCIKIMQHGWISEKSRSLVFDWMISYVTGQPAPNTGVAYSQSSTDSDKKAANSFPWYLNRQQLDDLWDQGLASYRRDKGNASLQRWKTIPWLHICAERGDIEALRLLLGPSFPSLTPNKAEYPRDDGRPTPIMRAISAGHRDLATLLIREQIFWPRDTQGYCPHSESFSTGKSTCYVCPYGQRTTIELAFFQGEIELAEAILERVPDSGFSNPEWYDLPRVLSYGNAMAEWIQIRLPLNGYLEGGSMMQLYRQGDLHCETLKGLDQEMKELSKLRMEISEIRDAFIARAKSLKRERAV